MAFFRKSTNVVYVLELFDQVSGQFVETATVTAQLLGKDDLPVAGAGAIAFDNLGQPVTIDNVTYAAGNYLGQLPHTVELDEDWDYVLEITAIYGTAPNDYHRVWRLDAKAKYGAVQA